MRFLASLLAVLFLIAGAPDAPAQAPSASEQLEQLFEDEWEFRLQENPLFATSQGHREFNDQLPSVSLADAERRHEKQREFLERLRQIDRAALDEEEQLNYDIFEHLKEDAVTEGEFQDYLLPITNRSGFHISFPQLADDVPLNNVEDYENYISRINQFEQYAEGHIELMREGIAQGMVLPEVSLEGIDEVLQAQIVEDAEESRLYEPFESFPERIPEQERERLTAEGEQAILNSVVPGYERFLSFMEEEYIPAAREDIAAASLPNGEAYYEHLVHSFTTLDLTPEEVHEMGLDEVARIRAEMMEIVEQEGFGDDFDGFVEFLRTDDQFYADSAEELMKEVAYVLKQMDGRLPQLFETLPRMPYGIREVPDYIAPRTTTAYYSRPAGDGTRAGFYYVNTYDLPSRPLYEVEALSLHEAVPGHHLQIALQQELEGLPDFRRFSSFTVFVEGWALYAERLGLEAGFYEDPYSDFGRLSYEMWRALRLVVDTGMHYLDWSRQEAIDYMAENSALAMHNIESEVDRYISWPGQALAYKIGELKIRELRDEAEEQLGEDFDIRTFHDAVLENGSIPLDVLETHMHGYIQETAQQ